MKATRVAAARRPRLVGCIDLPTSLVVNTGYIWIILR